MVQRNRRQPPGDELVGPGVTVGTSDGVGVIVAVRVGGTNCVKVMVGVQVTVGVVV